jgi:hypothetical protein
MTDLPTREQYMSMTDDEQDAFDRKHPSYANKLMVEGLEIRESVGNRQRREERERRDAVGTEEDGGDDDE